MRLFLISKPGCHHISELMKGIQAVYQLEAEFEPYLMVDFLPNKNNDHAGVILQAGKEIIRKNYTFDDPNDIEELRKLIWHYLRKYHKVKDITDNKGCIKDFRETQTNQVIQGWQAKKKLLKKDVCCRVIRDMLAHVIYKQGAPDFSAQLIKHPVYRYDGRDLQNRRLCKKNRYGECGDNYPKGSVLFKRCVDEVTWLCNKGYPKNKVRKATENYREELKKNVLKYLKENDMRVDKKMLDLILSAGFFERVSGRVGNRAASFRQTVKAVDDSLNDFDYFSKFIEGFGDKDKGPDKSTSFNDSSNIWIYLLIAFIVIMIIYYFKKN